MCVRPSPRLPLRISEIVDGATPISLAASAWDAPRSLKKVSEHLHPAVVRDGVMDLFGRFNEVRQDVKIVPLSSRELVTGRERVDDLRRAIKVTFGAEGAEGNLATSSV